MNARRDGEDLPPEVAVDDQGQITRDAHAVTALLPFGGHKGYALGFMIDILCGLLNGMAFGPHITAMYGDLTARRNLGSLMIAVDPQRFAGGPQFADQVARMAREVRAQTSTTSGVEVLAPGDPEYRTEQERLRTGIPVEPGLVEEIREWSARLGIAAPLEDGR